MSRSVCSRIAAVCDRITFPALAVVAVAALAGASGCRGRTSTRPPFHLISDMDWQPKYRPQAESAFFADHRAMRMPIEGTVARGALHEDESFWLGVQPGTQVPLVRSPVPTTMALMERGRERFNIYCAPCHDRVGSGRGLVVTRGAFFPPPDFHADRVRTMPDGEIFRVISQGVRNMPSYAAQVPVEDRWAIVAWLRVLERSQRASQGDVPAAERDRIEPPSPQGAPK